MTIDITVAELKELCAPAGTDTHNTETDRRALANSIREILIQQLSQHHTECRTQQ